MSKLARIRSRPGQTRALLSLRWSMVRESRSRLGLALLGGCALGALIGAVLVGAGFSDSGDRSFGVALVMPSLLLGFALSTVLSPLAAGGGNQLFPPDQLSPYPLGPSTHFRSSLLLAPLNLAWLIQVIALAGATSFITGSEPRVLLALAVTATYVVFATVAGQALAWWIVGLRQLRVGRIALLAIACVLVTGAIALLATDRLIAFLDESPTTMVVGAAANAYAGDLIAWLPLTLLILGLAGGAYLLGVRACSWTFRTPSLLSDAYDARVMRRRSRAPTEFGELLAVDRANVWRSTSLRRGLYVLGLLPGIVAALAGMSWTDLPLLPGLVAAGSGLLFGVNAFCLDSSGALWLASLPHSYKLTFLVRTVTVLEVGVVTMTLGVIAGSLRAGTPPNLTTALSVLCCSVAGLAWVTATCMRLSITRPHRADLRGPRDTPAPPGAMAAYSARLAAGTTCMGVAFALVARLGDPVLPLLLALVILLWSARSLVTSARLWANPFVRARVVATVSTG